MSTPSLGRLVQVELRDAWTSESSHFTPWLAQEENLRLLGEAIKIELELESQEKDVGPFRADILCRDTTTDQWVLIENQLERTDHSHLGQLLTYAAGLEAVTIVWIARRFTDEHRAALDWLNEHTDEKINLFGLEIELWRIGNSPIAPKFNIISQPNGWSRMVKEGAATVGEVSSHKLLQLKFWTAFKAHMESHNKSIRCTKPGPKHWMNHPLGRAWVHLASITSFWNSVSKNKRPEIRVELNMGGPNAEREWKKMEEKKESIQRNLGFEVAWHHQDDKAVCRIVARKDADFLNEALWPEQFKWLEAHLVAMDRVFRPLVRKMKLTMADMEE